MRYMRFKRPDGSFTYFVGCDPEAMTNDARLHFGGTDGEVIDSERLLGAWPADRDRAKLDEGVRFARGGGQSFWLFT